MVAENIPLPNIRKFFIPDPNYILFEADLSGADAQVVAWEAGDEDLKSAFRQGLKLHIKNARDVYPEIAGDMTDEELKATDRPGGLYHNCKRRVHAANYYGTPKTLATTLKTSLREEQKFQSRWFSLHPGIREWHNRTRRHLEGVECWNCYTRLHIQSPRCPSCNSILGRKIKNKFGFVITYFDRVENILPEALAWIPQSTVGLTCSKGMIQVEHLHPYVELLLQVHDSTVGQIPQEYESFLPQIHKDLHISIPYDDPLTIQWGFDYTTESWGAISG